MLGRKTLRGVFAKWCLLYLLSCSSLLNKTCDVVSAHSIKVLSGLLALLRS